MNRDKSFNRSDGRRRGKVMAIIGLVLGCFGVLFSSVLWLALLLPSIQAAREVELAALKPATT